MGKIKSDIKKGQKEIRKLVVAAIQPKLEHGEMQKNQDHALVLIEEAAKQGAQLVVLPELFSSGYFVSKEIWDFAESLDGPTVDWLKTTSKKLGIYVGAGFVETDGKDVYDSFAMTDPRGNIVGRIRKDSAEAYVFKRGRGIHIMNSDFGKVGVGICADNQLFSFLGQMHEESVDIVLMPHAAPLPVKTSRLLTEKDFNDMHQKLKELPVIYAKVLGVPVILVNPISVLKKMPGIFGSLMSTELFALKGLSRIVDSDGRVKGELGEEEGILVETVILDPGRKRFVEPQNYDGWLTPGSKLFRKVLVPFDIFLGKIYYALSIRRRKRAKAMEFKK